MDASKIQWCAKLEPLPRTLAYPENITKTIEVLRQAKSPLVIIGKGVAYGDASDEARKFLESTNLPFLATPMAKGAISDDHP